MSLLKPRLVRRHVVPKSGKKSEANPESGRGRSCGKSGTILDDKVEASCRRQNLKKAPKKGTQIESEVAPEVVFGVYKALLNRREASEF